jgi:hypothetical protein
VSAAETAEQQSKQSGKNRITIRVERGSRYEETVHVYATDSIAYEALGRVS